VVSWRPQSPVGEDIGTNASAGTVFLFDVDNTLLDNDRIREDLRERLRAAHGERVCTRYWEIMDELWDEVGYIDYLGALARLRLEEPPDFTIFRTATGSWTTPIADRLYPRALDAVKHVGQWGSVVILSDGDAAFQPREILRSGLWDAFDGKVSIYIHKERDFSDVERRHPASHNALIDDKARILAAAKLA
jgi:FMN phosphatase YigB (HAD superfamily)